MKRDATVPGMTGFANTDAITVPCPKCGSPIETACMQPAGKRRYPPHRERVAELFRIHSTEPWTSGAKAMNALLEKGWTK